jgi:hypothetical protein
MILCEVMGICGRKLTKTVTTVSKYRPRLARLLAQKFLHSSMTQHAAEPWRSDGQGESVYCQKSGRA